MDSIIESKLAPLYVLNIFVKYFFFLVFCFVFLIGSFYVDYQSVKNGFRIVAFIGLSFITGYSFFNLREFLTKIVIVNDTIDTYFFFGLKRILFKYEDINKLSINRDSEISEYGKKSLLSQYFNITLKNSLIFKIRQDQFDNYNHIKDIIIQNVNELKSK